MPKKEEQKQEVSVEDIKLDAQDDLKGEEKVKKVEEIELPEEFKDVKPEDLVKTIEEQREALAQKDEQITGQSTRLEGVEKQVNYLSGLADSMAQNQQKVEKKKEEIEFDIEKPMVSVRKVMAEERQKEKQEDQQVAYQRQFSQSQAAYNEGYQTMKGNPLFEGIEKQVSDKMGSYYSQFVGIPNATPEVYLRDSKKWIQVAQGIRLEREEYDKVDPGHIEPVEARGGARPDESRRDRDEFDTSLNMEDPETAAWMKENKLTIDDAQKIITAEAEETLKGGL